MRAPVTSTPAATPPIRCVRVAVYLCYAGEALAFSSVMARVPQVQRSHRLSDAAINVLVALVPVLAVAGGLLAARLCGRFGSALVLRYAQPVFFAGVVLLAAVRGTVALTAVVALFGVSMGVVEAAMNAQAVAVERHAGRSLVNGFFAVWSGASIGGSLWVSFANRADLSLPAGFAVPATAGLVIALVTVRMTLPRAQERRLERRASQGRDAAPAGAVPWRPLLVLGAALGCAYVSEGAIAGFAVKYVDDELGGADAVAPLAITAFAAATVTGRALADLVVRRRGAALIVRGGALLAALGLATVVLAPGSRPPGSGCARSRRARTRRRPATTRSGRASPSRGSGSSPTSARWRARGWSPPWRRCPATGPATWCRPCSSW
jgi:MFS family permease